MGGNVWDYKCLSLPNKMYRASFTSDSDFPYNAQRNQSTSLESWSLISKLVSSYCIAKHSWVSSAIGCMPFFLPLLEKALTASQQENACTPGTTLHIVVPRFSTILEILIRRI